MLTRTTQARSGRKSQGVGQTLFSQNGLGYVARRGIDLGSSVAVRSLEGVARMAATQPLELLSLLPDIVPEMGLAVWNSTNMGAGPNRFRLKAMTVVSGGESEEAPDGTAAIDELWANNPDEAGDLIDCAAQMFQMLQFSGMNACEAVPAARGRGLSAVYPINSLTLRFRRDGGGVLVLDQRQAAVNNGISSIAAGLSGNFVPMPMDRVFYAKMPALPDEPYGRAPFGAALTIVLETLAFWRDVMMSFHRIGTPKLDVSFDYEMWARIAKEFVGYTTDEEIDAYVQRKFDKTVKLYEGLQADDTFFHGLNEKVSSVGASESWPNISAIWSMLRLRLVQALKQLPTMLGIVEGDSETWSRVQFEVFVEGLEMMTQKALKPILRATQLHLQLLGMPYVAKIDITPIRSINRLLDAQSVAIETTTAARQRDEGFISQDTAAMGLTGSAAVGTPRSWSVPVKNESVQIVEKEP